MKTHPFLLSLLIAILLGGIHTCNRSAGEGSGGQESDKNAGAPVVKIESEEQTGSGGEIEVKSMESGERCAVVPEDGWLSFEVPITAAGRYRTMVHMAPVTESWVSCWIEDYVDNRDGRQYNITGIMEVPVSDNGEGLVTLVRDGSPLNKGVHKMKLHVAGGEAVVDWIQFELIKNHQATPQVLTQKMDGDEWVVAWSDEFETDGLIDTSRWTYDIGNWGWGNNELQYYTEGRSENARIENGNLVIESHKDDLGEKWTSARITTRGKTSFLYGRVEFRARVPAERGNWAAGWTLGDAYVDEMSWPYCGEIDIMESVGYEIDDDSGDGLAHASVHCGAYYFKLNNQPTAITPVEDMSGEFHTYAIQWTPEYLKAFVDDIQYFTYSDTSDSLTWPFDRPQNIILNLAMGGGWGGARGMDETVTSQQIVIDYVRVYELR